MKTTGAEIQPISVLYVDDEPALLDIGKAFLEQKAGIQVDTKKTATDALRELQKRSYDVIISDYMMPGVNGLAFLKTLKENGDTTPFIIFTGRGREEIAIEAFESGADFYIQKGGDPKSQFAELESKVRKAFNLRRSEKEIVESEKMFRALVENALDGILITDFSGNILFCNHTAAKIIGVPDAGLLAGLRNVMEFIASESKEAVLRDFSQVAHGIDSYLVNYQLITDNRQTIWVECIGKKIEFQGKPAMIVSMRDITERKKGEEALRESEEKYRLIAENTADLICIHDMSFMPQYISPSVFMMKGFTVEEALAQTAEETWTPESFAMLHELFQRELALDASGNAQPDRTVYFETEEFCRDGSIILVENSARWIRDSNGKAIGILGISRDITGRRKAEEELRAAYEELMSQEEELRGQYDALATTEAEWKTTFNAITDWISLLTPNGTILKTNSAVEMLLGVPADHIPGMKCFELVHGTICPIPECPFHRMKESRKQETSLVSKPNGTGWFEVTVDPVIEPSGAITGVVHIVRDITESTRTQKALEQAKKKLNLLNYVTINDLQNMILTISGYQQIIKETIPANPALPMMEKQEEMLQKVTNTLGFAQSFQNLGLKPARWQDPGHVFLMAISHLDFLRVKHCIELYSLEIFADPQLEQVFLILADNTLKHGGSADSVRIYSRYNGASITIVYEDNGPGIPDDLKEKIFLPDFQKKKGVGLFLAREILEITGITILETGVYGEGVRFEILVPGGSWRKSE